MISHLKAAFNAPVPNGTNKDKLNKGEIDRDFYCSAYCYNNEHGRCLNKTCIVNENKCEQKRDNCKNYHLKWPTPKQYELEYDEEYSEANAVYCQHHDTDWFVTSWENAKDSYMAGKCLVVCACTPWGKPPADWRPE